MEYIKKTNLEILQELYLSPTSGWYPVNITVNTVNPFRDENINRTVQLSDSIVVTDWDIDAFVAIYPNHSNYMFKKVGGYSSKIKILPENTVKRINQSEEIETTDLSIELPIESFQSENRVHLKNIKVPFSLYGSLTTIGVLSLNSNIDFDKFEFKKDMLKTYKDENLLIETDKMTEDEYNSFLNLSYRIVGVHFTNIRMVTKQKISQDDIDKYRQRNKEYDKKVYDFEEDNSGMFSQHKSYAKEAQERILEEKVKTQAFIDKVKEKAGEMMASAIPHYEDKVNKFLESIAPIRREDLKLFPIYRAAELFLGKGNSLEDTNVFTRFLFFDVEQIYNGDEKLKDDFINKLYKFFIDTNIQMKPIKVFFKEWKTLFISVPELVFTSKVEWWIPYKLETTRLTIYDTLNSHPSKPNEKEREEIVSWIVGRFDNQIKVHDKGFESYLFNSDFKPNVKSFKECLEKMAYLSEVKSTYFNLGAFVGQENLYLIDKEEILKTLIFEFACVADFFNFRVSGYNEDRREIILEYHNNN